MVKIHGRIERERKTIAIMINLYCRHHHSPNRLCSECSTLLDYACQRLDKCPFQEGKPTCARCPAHCYKPQMREMIRRVMRYSGPKMIYRHPVLAIKHLIDSRRREPVRRRNQK